MAYMAQAYIGMLDWVAGRAGSPFDTGGMKVPALVAGSDQLSGPAEVDVTLGACLAMDACATGRRMEREVGPVDPGELARRSKLGELMVKGFEYYTITVRHGELSLREPDVPYSPKLVAAVVAYSVHEAMEFTDDSQYREFYESFRPLQ